MKILQNTLILALFGLLGSSLIGMERPPSRGNTVILQVDETSLHKAVTAKDLNLVNYLLHNRMVPINGQDEAGNTALHILKSQMALLPLSAKNTEEQAKDKTKLQNILLILQREGVNSQLTNKGSITAQEWYNFLANDIEQDKIIPKLAELPIWKESLLFNNVPEKFITESADSTANVDTSDHNFVTIEQIRGDRKMHLRLEKISKSPSWFTNKPLTFTAMTKEKMLADDDHLHNFSIVSDQFLDWGKKISAEDLRNHSWIQLLLHNVKFEQRDHQQDSYMIILKGGYCLTDITDKTPYELVVKSKGLIPAALIYLFYKDSNICYHRYLHRATDIDKFERSFTKLQKSNH